MLIGPFTDERIVYALFPWIVLKQFRIDQVLQALDPVTDMFVALFALIHAEVAVAVPDDRGVEHVPAT